MAVMTLRAQLPSEEVPLPDFGAGVPNPPVRERIARRLNPVRPSHFVDATRSRLESMADRAEIRRLRGGRDVVWHDESEPLVTIRIATYSAGDVLREVVHSALQQTYDRVEVLVVGDACDDVTAAAATSFRDSRVRFVNLPFRGQYPDDARQRWMVAGTAPMNAALDLARGSWIAPCDDDDLLTDDHVELLVAHALAERLEFVWSRAAMQYDDGRWSRTTSGPLRMGQVSHGSVLYAGPLRFMRYNRRAYLLDHPADWEMWQRMQRAGVRMGFLDRITYFHFA